MMGAILPDGRIECDHGHVHPDEESYLACEADHCHAYLGMTRFTMEAILCGKPLPCPDHGVDDRG